MTNNRQIKFRVWDKNTNTFVDSAHTRVGIHNSILSLEFPDYWIAQQFTGLTDKNGKEIYEGDIVKIGLFALNDPNVDMENEGLNPNDISTETAYHTVVWDYRNSLSYLQREIEQNPDLSGVEVMGNIFENPGVITGK